MLEEYAEKGRFKNLDLLIYPISLTSSTIATYPMLDPDLEEYPDFDPKEICGNEKTRKYSRFAKNPLSCYFGKDNDPFSNTNTNMKIHQNILPVPTDRRLDKTSLFHFLEHLPVKLIFYLIPLKFWTAVPQQVFPQTKNYVEEFSATWQQWRAPRWKSQ